MASNLTKEIKQKLKAKLLEEEDKIIEQLRVFTIADEDDPGGFRTKMNPEEDTGRGREDNVQDDANLANKRATETVLEGKLKVIRDALERIDRDEFGLCEQCGEPIDIKRLEFNPSASTCMKCEN